MNPLTFYESYVQFKFDFKQLHHPELHLVLQLQGIISSTALDMGSLVIIIGFKGADGFKG